MKSTRGLTLLEVVIALVILSVGVLMAAGMQTNALQASSDATAIQSVTKVAESELEFRRKIDLTLAIGKATTCMHADTDGVPNTDGSSDGLPSGHTCKVVVATCTLDALTPSGTRLACPPVAAGPLVADQVTVTITGSRSKATTLRTVKAR